MTLKHRILIFRVAWGLAAIITAVLLATGHLANHLVQGVGGYWALMLVSLLIRCPKCQLRVSLRPEFWFELKVLEECPVCGSDWAGRTDSTTVVDRMRLHHGGDLTEEPPSARLRKAIRPKRFSIRALGIATVVLPACMSIVALLVAVGCDSVDPRIAVAVVPLSGLSAVVVRLFIRCRRCGASAFLYGRWVSAAWPPKSCYRCGQSFLNDR